MTHRLYPLPTSGNPYLGQQYTPSPYYPPSQQYYPPRSQPPSLAPSVDPKEYISVSLAALDNPSITNEQIFEQSEIKKLGMIIGDEVEVKFITKKLPNCSLCNF
jgi:hypothetical protein